MWPDSSEKFWVWNSLKCYFIKDGKIFLRIASVANFSSAAELKINKMCFEVGFKADSCKFAKSVSV